MNWPKPTPANTKKLIAQSLSFIELAKTKKLDRKENEDFWSCLHHLQRQAEPILTNQDSFDLFLDYLSKVEGYTSQNRNDVAYSWSRLLGSIPFTIRELQDENGNISPDIKKRIVLLSILIVKKVDQKPARTDRISRLRKDLWETLTHLSEEFPCLETLSAAQKIASSAKHKEDERYGATLCLLELWRDDDHKTTKIIESLKRKPPNEHTLFAILDHEVNFDGLDELSALIQLEDWRDADTD